VNRLVVVVDRTGIGIQQHVPANKPQLVFHLRQVADPIITGIHQVVHANPSQEPVCHPVMVVHQDIHLIHQLVNALHQPAAHNHQEVAVQIITGTQQPVLAYLTAKRPVFHPRQAAVDRTGIGIVQVVHVSRQQHAFPLLMVADPIIIGIQVLVVVKLIPQVQDPVEVVDQVPAAFHHRQAVADRTGIGIVQVVHVSRQQHARHHLPDAAAIIIGIPQAAAVNQLQQLVYPQHTDAVVIIFGILQAAVVFIPDRIPQPAFHPPTDVVLIITGIQIVVHVNTTQPPQPRVHLHQLVVVLTNIGIHTIVNVNPTVRDLQIAFHPPLVAEQITIGIPQVVHVNRRQPLAYHRLMAAERIIIGIQIIVIADLKIQQRFVRYL
jgi:hypothetical protein